MLFVLCIRMADNQLQNDLKNIESKKEEEQTPLNGTSDDSTTNNVPEQLEYARDDDRSDPSIH